MGYQGLKERMISELENNWQTNSAIYLTEKTASEVLKLTNNSEYEIKPDWLIKNIESKWCKWYCMKSDWTPKICSNPECKNYKNAVEIAKRIKDYKEKVILESIY